MSSPMEKCLSLPHFIPGWTNCYLTEAPLGSGTWTMKQELKDLRCSYVKFWISWYQLAQGLGRAPTSYLEQASMMSNSYGWIPPVRDAQGKVIPTSNRPAPAYVKRLIQYFDDMIRAANNTVRWDADPTKPKPPKVKVILAVYQDAPTWSWTTNPDPNVEAGTGKEAKARFPDELTANTPYGWFIQYLVARYGRVGDLSVPFVDAIEPLNEPNYAWWPQPQDGPTMSSCKAAAAMSTCEAWCAKLARDNRKPPIMTLGPSSSDTPYDEKNGVPFTTDYMVFTKGVLGMLNDWKPWAPVRWAHHNYEDVDIGKLNGAYRAARVQAELGPGNWLNQADPTGHNDPAPRDIWLTEVAARMGLGQANYNDPANGDPLDPTSQKYAMQVEQASRTATNMRDMRSLPGPVLWTQHTINDNSPTGDDPTYALREPWGTQPGSPAGPGRPRQAWDAFRKVGPTPAQDLP